MLLYKKKKVIKMDVVLSILYCYRVNNTGLLAVALVINTSTGYFWFFLGFILFIHCFLKLLIGFLFVFLNLGLNIQHF